MAHAAEIDNQGIVKRVIVVEDYYGDLTCEQWCEQTYGGTWKKTSYNTQGGKHILGGTPFRKNYAGIGYKYDAERDAFYWATPYKSWKLDEETCLWYAPKPKPKKGEWRWNEDIIEWEEIK